MKKKIVALFLCLTVVFTMTVPVSAKTLPKVDKVAYMAIGDSIGAGCKNLDFMFTSGNNLEGDDPNFTAFTYNLNAEDGKKDTNIFAVPFSYVYKLAKRFNADKTTSFNGTYVGLRSKDVCHILGVKEMKEDDYSSKDDKWANSYMNWFTRYTKADETKVYNWSRLFTADVRQAYQDAIATSDIITVELGGNDISAFYMNNSKAIVSAFAASAGPIEDAQSLINSFSKHYYNLISAKTTEDRTTAYAALNKDFCKFINLGGDVVSLVKDILDIMEKMTKESRYYFKALMDYINENKLPDATVIVSTVINPLSDADVEAGKAFLQMQGDILEESGIELESMVDMMNLVIAPYVLGTNAYINQLSTTTTYKNGKKTTKRNYYVADLTGVTLNPGNKNVGTENEIRYLLHPDEIGQKTIADRFYYAKPTTDAIVAVTKMTRKAIKKAIVERKKIA